MHGLVVEVFYNIFNLCGVMIVMVVGVTCQVCEWDSLFILVLYDIESTYSHIDFNMG